MRNPLLGILAVILIAMTGTFAVAQGTNEPDHVVANTLPPDDYLSLRSEPTTRYGRRLATLPNGTRVRVLRRRSDGWWFVEVASSGQRGWALSGSGGRNWIEKIATASPAINQFGVAFRTPSDNVHCFAPFVEGSKTPIGIACDIKDRGGNGPIIPKPADCEYDWGQRFELGGETDAALECASDWVGSDTSQTLQYGQSIRVGKITCISERRGLTCKNEKGHGFFLSKNLQELF